MRRTLITLIVLAVLATAGIWTYQSYFAQASEPVQEREEAVVERGSLVSMVNATGTILPERQTTLIFKTPGLVEEVLVEEGEFVQADQVLARLETADLDFAVFQAELAVSQAEQAVSQSEMALGSAQAQLLRLQRPVADYEIAAAKASLESAQASYERLQAGPTEEEVTVARTNLAQAEAALEQAQRAYDQVADRPEVAMLPQALQLEQATIAYKAAKASFELTMRPPSEAELAAAQTAIVQAETALARLQEGVSEEDLLVAQLGVEQAQLGVEQAQLGVEQAQLSLEQARHQLAGTVLTAPHAGTITRVGVKAGELTGGQSAFVAFVLTDLSEYHIDITVDEIDIGRVAVGQPVTVTLDALPGEVLTGQIERIAETAQIDTGIVSYQVTVRLDPTDAPLRVGLTANVDVVTERRESVLLVPNRYVRIDRATDQAFVDRAVNGAVQPTEIQIGLRDEFYSEVRAGLEAGDVVVLVKESSREQLRQTFMGGP